MNWPEAWCVIVFISWAFGTLSFMHWIEAHEDDD